MEGFEIIMSSYMLIVYSIHGPKDKIRIVQYRLVA